jgi:hypothetical protein
MTYTVTWDPDAEQELAALWLAAPDRAALTATVGWIERLLARDPLHAGAARTSSVHRAVVAGGLAVEFEIIEDDKRVLVHHVSATA